MSNPRKAVFFDIDGTLWDRQMTIPDSTKEGINSLRQNGHYAFISTGRTRSFINKDKLLAIGFDGILAGCGTYIEFGEEVMYYKKIEPDMLKKTMDIFKRHNISPVFEGSKSLYVHRDFDDQDLFMKALKQQLGDDLLLIEEHETDCEVSKYSIAIKDISIDLLANDLKPWYDMIVHGKEAIEIIPKGFGKASGIKTICEKLEINQEDTYAFGDSANDIDMLTYVAHGIAMGNGTDEAKQAADYVTTNLLNDGIYHGLKHFGLI